MAIWCHSTSSFTLYFLIFKFLQRFFYNFFNTYIIYYIGLFRMSCIVFMYFLYMCITVLLFGCNEGTTTTIIMKKRSERRKHCARAGRSKVRTPPARLPARPLSQTHRQDRLQYTAPQLASAQCNNRDTRILRDRLRWQKSALFHRVPF